MGSDCFSRVINSNFSGDRKCEVNLAVDRVAFFGHARSANVPFVPEYLKLVAGHSRISGSMPIIPVTASAAGIYVNFLTGTTGSLGSTTIDWKLNAYAFGGALNFFSSNATSNATRYVGSGRTVNELSAGPAIDATSTFGSAGIAPSVAFRARVTF